MTVAIAIAGSFIVGAAMTWVLMALAAWRSVRPFAAGLALRKPTPVSHYRCQYCDEPRVFKGFIRGRPTLARARRRSAPIGPTPWGGDIVRGTTSLWHVSLCRAHAEMHAKDFQMVPIEACAAPDEWTASGSEETRSS